MNYFYFLIGNILYRNNTSLIIKREKNGIFDSVSGIPPKIDFFMHECQFNTVALNRSIAFCSKLPCRFTQLYSLSITFQFFKPSWKIFSNLIDITYNLKKKFFISLIYTLANL